MADRQPELGLEEKITENGGRVQYADDVERQSHGGRSGYDRRKSEDSTSFRSLSRSVHHSIVLPIHYRT
ncbi:hypothetical protein LTR60_006950, partial [Cryomyces antarcticus]